MADLRIGATTHGGRVRPANEDSLLVTDRVFVVADGMGGHEAGEVASQIAVERMSELLGGDRLPTARDVVAAIRSANGDIFRAAIANPGQAGMGTTVTVVAVIADDYAGRAEPNVAGRSDGGPNHDAQGVDGPSGDVPSGDESDPAESPSGADRSRLPGDVTPVVPAEPSEALVIANVGDSRTYLYRHDRLRRVTVDHSYVQELVSTGHLSEDEARNHPRRNIVTRALGIEPDVRVDWWTVPLIRGDRFLLCSDGLVDEVHDDDITAALDDFDDPQLAADHLVLLANEAGGRDNVTVIVVDVLDGDDPPDPTQEIDVAPLWADGSADPTPAGTLELDADPGLPPPAGPAVADPTASPGSSKRRRPLRKFAIGFAIAAVIVVAFVVLSVWARSGYYVAFDDNDQAIIYQGRPGGVLWIEPTAENEMGPARDDLEPDIAAEIDDEPRFDSADEAADFIRSGVTTTTTTTTTTTIPPPATTAPADTAPGGVTTIAAP